MQNMSLTEKISTDLRDAMKTGNKVTLEALRAAKTAFLLAISEKGAGSVLTSEEELRIISKLVKQRKESAAIYREQNRDDLYDNEMAEATALEKYLPARMSTEELRQIISTIIEKTGAKSSTDMRKVMGSAMKELSGRADGKEISAIVKELLQ